MNYAIHTLEIEAAKQLETIREVARLSVNPEYKGDSAQFERNFTEINMAINILKNNRG